MHWKPLTRYYSFGNFKATQSAQALFSSDKTETPFYFIDIYFYMQSPSIVLKL